MSYANTDTEGFLIKNYNRYIDLPFSLLDELSFAVYIIDYNWTYLFLNKNSKATFGKLADELIGKNALEVFQDPKFNLIFEKIKSGVDKKISIHAVVDSPLRGQQILLKGYPLEDCYFFSSTAIPGTLQVIEELREELKRRTDESTEHVC